MPMKSARSSRTVRVNEIFASIQGEGTRAGDLCAFVRLTGCNLRCAYCDTAYAFHEGEDLSVDEVLTRLSDLGLPLVCVTGGEPMLQREAVPMLQALVERGYCVLLETSGSRPLELVPAEVIKVVDIKTPGATRAQLSPTAIAEGRLLETFHAPNLETLLPHDLVKLVVTSRADYEWARAVIRGHRLSSAVERVLLSPSHGQVHPRDLVAWMLEDRLEARLNLQQHKYIWGADVRGV